MHTPPHITHKASCIKLRSDIQSASHRAFTLQATGVAMANATYMFMRENSRFEMMRAVGGKAVASVEMAVPPTMVAGKLSVRLEISEASMREDDKASVYWSK